MSAYIFCANIAPWALGPHDPHTQDLVSVLAEIDRVKQENKWVLAPHIGRRQDNMLRFKPKDKLGTVADQLRLIKKDDDADE